LRQHERHFGTERLRTDLRHHSVRSGFVAAGGRVLQILLQIGSVMVLARILTPGDFGVLAMVLPVTILVNTVANQGLQTTIIHRSELNQPDASALFWLAIRVNFGVAILMGASGPALARIYNDDRITWYTAAWAFIIFGASTAAVHEALLKRQMRFGMVTIAHVCALAAGVIAAVVAALLGARHWALLVQIGVMDLGRAGAMWAVSGWRPDGPRTAASRQGPNSLRTYWAGLAGFRLVSWMGDHIDRIVVGAIAGASILGLYDAARRWAWFVFIELFMTLSDVAVAALSRVQKDGAIYRAYVKSALLPMLAFPLPASAFIFVAAQEVVLVLLGDQWLGMQPFLRLMCVAAFFGSIGRLSQWIYLSRGETGRQLRWAIISSPVLIVAVLVGARWGAFGVAAGFTTATVMLSLPNVAWAVHGSALSIRDVLAVAVRPAYGSILAALVLALSARMLPGGLPLLLRFTVEAAIFGIVYVLAWVVTADGRAAMRRAFAVTRELRARPRHPGFRSP
jgi:PST family polysaccharide transporter